MIDAKIKVISLNPHMVKMVKPKECLKGYFSHIYADGSAPIGKFCKDCEYIVKETCSYKIYTTELATGNYEEGDRDYHYIQFCCANCGELIKMRDRISYIYYNLSRDVLHCPQCNTAHKCLEHEKDVAKFAIPVKVKGN